MKKTIFRLMFLGSLFINAQDNGSLVILKASAGGIQNSSFYVYEPPFKAKGIYNDTLQAVNKYPEQLMSSIMSENSETWYHYNSQEKEAVSAETKARFKKVSQLDINKNYFELLHKFEFTLNNQEYAIIKFNLILEEKDKPIKGAYTLLKTGDKWKKTSTSQTFKMTMLHVFFKTDRLQQVFKGTLIGNNLMDNLIKKVYDNEILNMDKLLNQFENWSKNNETEKLEYFTEKPNWNN